MIVHKEIYWKWNGPEEFIISYLKTSFVLIIQTIILPRNVSREQKKTNPVPRVMDPSKPNQHYSAWL